MRPYGPRAGTPERHGTPDSLGTPHRPGAPGPAAENPVRPPPRPPTVQGVQIYEIHIRAFAGTDAALALQEPLARLLCPVEDHVGPCEVPWGFTLGDARGPDDPECDLVLGIGGVAAFPLDELWHGGAFKYDPNEYHGPTLYYLTLPAAWLGGARDYRQTTEMTYRVIPVLFGKAFLQFAVRRSVVGELCVILVDHHEIPLRVGFQHRGVPSGSARRGRLDLGEFSYYADLSSRTDLRTVPAPPAFERRFARVGANSTIWINTTYSPDVQWFDDEGVALEAPNRVAHPQRLRGIMRPVQDDLPGDRLLGLDQGQRRLG